MLLAHPPHPPLCQLPWLAHYTYCTSSSVPDVNYRCSQASSASSAFKTLDPFSQKFKLRVYGSESQVYPVLSSCLPSSIRISDSRIKYLGHSIRHPTSPEFHICFNNSLSLRTISSPFRRGAPRAHWPEIALAESAHCLQHLRQNPPVLGHFLHLFYSHFTIVELKTFSAASMKQWYNTTRFVHLLFPLAEHQEQWKLLIPKMK